MTDQEKIITLLRSVIELLLEYHNKIITHRVRTEDMHEVERTIPQLTEIKNWLDSISNRSN